MVESIYAIRDPYCSNNCLARYKNDDRYCSKRDESPMIRQHGLQQIQLYCFSISNHNRIRSLFLCNTSKGLKSSYDIKITKCD